MNERTIFRTSEGGRAISICVMIMMETFRRRGYVKVGRVRRKEHSGLLVYNII